MKHEEILKTARIAQELLSRIEAYTKEMESQKRRGYYPNAPLQSGALRRTSMDLTRQLAQMRKP